jgi:hypothetical protein
MQDEALQLSCALTLARCLEYTQDVEVQIKAAQVAGRMCVGAKESPSATRLLYEVRHFFSVQLERIVKKGASLQHLH